MQAHVYVEAGILQPAHGMILKLLQATNGGPVSFELIGAYVWPDGRPKQMHCYISMIRRQTGLGIVAHASYAYQLDPKLDADWVISDPFRQPTIYNSQRRYWRAKRRLPERINAL